MLEEGEVVLCTVDRIMGTIVFVNIEGTNKEGTIITSEIAAGRIRNLRDYVVPKKKIVCKILRIQGDKINLSLRRVTKKEQKEVIDQHNQEKSYKAIFRTILGKEKSQEIIDKTTKNQRLFEFIKEIKKDSKHLEKLIGKDESKKILNILEKQKKKTAIVKKQLELKTEESNGIKLIKKILGEIKEAKIKYISAGKYSIKAEAESVKEADQKIKNIFEEIEKQAKKNNLKVSLMDNKKA